MEPVKRPWLRRVLTDHWELKMASIVLAVISWHAIRDAISFEMLIRDVKLDTQLRDGMAVLNQSASTVDVTFRGAQDDIQRLEIKNIRAVVDLRGIDRSTTEVISIESKSIEGARGVTVIDINPPRIRFTIDREDEKIVPVKGRITGYPLSGEVESIVCEPSRVTLRGPARQLRLTEEVLTQPIDVEGRVASFGKRVPLISPGDNWVARIDPPEVRVQVAIASKAARRTLEAQTVSAINAPGEIKKITITPAQVTVLLLGPSEELKTVEEAALRTFIECTGLRVGSYELPVQVYLPHSGKIAVTTDPAVVQVTIRE